MRFIRYSVLVLMFLGCMPDRGPMIEMIDPISRSPALRSLDSMIEERITASGILSEVMSFGGVNSFLENEYILSDARSMAVNIDGDMIAYDELRLKIFDTDGKEKVIIGKPWDAAQYGTYCALYINPDGYLIVADMRSSGSDLFQNFFGRRRLNDYYSLYAPDLTLIERQRFQDNSRLMNYMTFNDIRTDYLGNIYAVYPVSQTEKVIEIRYTDDSDDAEFRYNTELLYDNSREIVPLIHKKLHESSSSLRPTYPSGTLHWALLPGKNIVYVHDDEDVHDTTEGSFYTTHILSLTTGEDREITIPFTPVQPTERLKERYEIEYYPAVQNILADGNTVYVFAFHPEGLINIRTEVIDAEKAEVINTVEFPAIPLVIKNGHAYRIYRQDNFRKVVKYRIDPEVYR